MTQEEFNRRCNEVFMSNDGDYYLFMQVTDGKPDRVVIAMEESYEGGLLAFNYMPDMTERPEALDYLLGNRDDFND